MSEETLQEVEFVGPGAILRNAREEQGLSVETVAEKLHLRLTIIKSLEADEYSTDISPTFTKGYLKLYSKLLGLDEGKVLTAYQQMGALEKEPAKLQSFSQKVARQASDQRLMLFTYFVLAIVLALVVVWWMQQDDSSFTSTLEKAIQSPATEQTEPAPQNAGNEPDAQPTSVDTADDEQTEAAIEETTANRLEESVPASEIARPEIADPALNEESAAQDSQEAAQQVSQSQLSQPDVQTVEGIQDDIQEQTDTLTNNQVETASTALPVDDSATDLNGVGDEFGSQAEDSLDDLTTSDETDAENPDLVFNDQPTVADSTVYLTDPVELVFEFSGDCWMKLTDATGEDVAYGIKASGRVMPVSGIPPFEVVLGAPESVQITYAGEAIDMTQFRPGYTARFKLPLTD